MANDQNIIPHQFTSDQSREAAATNGRKGGIASGEVTRERKTIAEMLRKVLDEPLPGNPTMTRGEGIVQAIAGRTYKGGKAGDLKVLAEVLGEQVQKIEHKGLPTPVLVNSQETADHLANLKQRKTE